MITNITPPHQREFEAWLDQHVGRWARKGWYDRQGTWHYRNPVVTRLLELFKETRDEDATSNGQDR